VDDAIVVLENIYRHMEMGKTKFELPMMVQPKLVELVSITLVIVVVFFTNCIEFWSGF
jgi:HAE1 family hydrophobic/amphiphilic exporter-1